MEELKKYLSVGVFAFLGGSLRTILAASYSFMGTLIVNLTGCFILAFLTYFLLEYPRLAPWLTAGLGSGFVGAYTTFSSFNLDTYKLITTGSINAVGYFIATVILGFLIAYLGTVCGQKMGRKVLK